jgi:hypothetical protein
VIFCTRFIGTWHFVTRLSSDSQGWQYFRNIIIMAYSFSVSSSKCLSCNSHSDVARVQCYPRVRVESDLRSGKCHPSDHPPAPKYDTHSPEPWFCSLRLLAGYTATNHAVRTEPARRGRSRPPVFTDVIYVVPSYHELVLYGSSRHVAPSEHFYVMFISDPDEPSSESGMRERWLVKMMDKYWPHGVTDGQAW